MPTCEECGVALESDRATYGPPFHTLCFGCALELPKKEQDQVKQQELMDLYRELKEARAHLHQAQDALDQAEGDIYDIRQEIGVLEKAGVTLPDDFDKETTDGNRTDRAVAEAPQDVPFQHQGGDG